MLQEFWSYFEITGDIGMYLGFKAYEQDFNSRKGNLTLPEGQSEVG